MRVLVTGGTGVVGRATVSLLVERGHTVRLLSRHADRDARQWPAGVEPFPGDVGRDETVRGCAEGCDVVLHIVGIVSELPPDLTFERINVEGTRRIVRETERAGSPRLVYVSALGADRGRSRYHRSKYQGEEIVRRYSGPWVICRPGNVYGPFDDEISLLLRMVRTLPVIPLLGGGEQEFQPVWHEDLARALVEVVERDDITRRVLELAGSERTSQRDLVDRFESLTGRSPQRLPVPESLASLGSRAAAALGVEVPFTQDQIEMLSEGNVVRAPGGNALTGLLGITPTPLARGLATLVREQPEMLPSEGVGSLERKRYWAAIHGATRTATEMLLHFRTHFRHFLPIDIEAEPLADTGLEEHATITFALPVRGHVQVRVEEVTDRSVTVVTLEGHALAGGVHFRFDDAGDSLLAEILIYERPATLVDFAVMRTVGGTVQDATWREVVDRIVRASGGTAPDGVQHETSTLSEAEAARVERWFEELTMRHRRETNAGQTDARPAPESESSFGASDQAESPPPSP